MLHSIYQFVMLKKKLTKKKRCFFNFIVDIQLLIIHLYHSIYYNFIMKEGKVKFFNDSKGFGFIKDNDSNNEYFVHVTGLIDEIKEDDDVTFELKEGRKGLNAVNVKLA